MGPCRRVPAPAPLGLVVACLPLTPPLTLHLLFVISRGGVFSETCFVAEEKGTTQVSLLG